MAGISAVAAVLLWWYLCALQARGGLEAVVDPRDVGPRDLGIYQHRDALRGNTTPPQATWQVGPAQV